MKSVILGIEEGVKLTVMAIEPLYTKAKPISVKVEEKNDAFSEDYFKLRKKKRGLVKMQQKKILLQLYGVTLLKNRKRRYKKWN
jgi:hypothetical protein